MPVRSTSRTSLQFQQPSKAVPADAPRLPVLSSPHHMVAGQINPQTALSLGILWQTGYEVALSSAAWPPHLACRTARQFTSPRSPTIQSGRNGGVTDNLQHRIPVMPHGAQGRPPCRIERPIRRGHRRVSRSQLHHFTIVTARRKWTSERGGSAAAFNHRFQPTYCTLSTFQAEFCVSPSQRFAPSGWLGGLLLGRPVQCADRVRFVAQSHQISGNSHLSELHSPKPAHSWPQ